MSRMSETERGRGQAVDLYEEAFQLLRRTPASVHALHLVGTVPFVLALGFFWADMSRGSTAATALAPTALVLTLAYFWMKTLQSLYCRALLDSLRPEGARVRVPPGRLARQTAALALIQSTSLPCQILAATVLLPIAWVAAFYQNASVLALSRDWGRPALRALTRESARLTHHLPAQNHFVLMIGFLFGMFVWIDILLAMMLGPVILKAFTGIESAFTRSPEAAFYNSTTLVVSMSAAFVLTSPLFKAVYTLRCFRGLSERSGEDLWSAFHAAREERRRLLSAGNAVLLAGALLALATATGVRAQDSGRAPQDQVIEGVGVESAPSNAGAGDEEAARFERTLDEVLARREFQWRLPRRGSSADAGGEESGDGISALLDRLGRSARDGWGSVERTLKGFWDWLTGGGGGAGRVGTGGSSGWGAVLAGISGMKLLVFAGLLVLLAAIVWAIVRALAARRERAATETAAIPPSIDLASEEVTAADLEEDAWLRLALEKLQAGEERLAVRAVFLASLAHLGARGLVSLKRFKSNRDYLSELRVKARGEQRVQEAFGAGTAVFERVWYGDHAASRLLVEEMRRHFDRLRGGGAASAAT